MWGGWLPPPPHHPHTQNCVKKNTFWGVNSSAFDTMKFREHSVERQTDRQTQMETGRERERERLRQTERQTHTERQRQKQTHTETEKWREKKNFPILIHWHFLERLAPLYHYYHYYTIPLYHFYTDNRDTSDGWKKASTIHNKQSMFHHRWEISVLD